AVSLISRPEPWRRHPPPGFCRPPASVRATCLVAPPKRCVLYSSGSDGARTPYLASPLGMASENAARVGCGKTVRRDQLTCEGHRVFRRQAVRLLGLKR